MHTDRERLLECEVEWSNSSQKKKKKGHGFSLIGGFLKNRLVIGLGSLLVLAQRQGWMTSGPR